ncbi:MAG: peptidylprolyl isomerase [Pirellulaceae bacterium]
MQAARLVLLGLAIVTLLAACWLTGCGGGKQDVPAASIPADNKLAIGGDAAPPTTSITPISAGAKRPAPPQPVDPIVLIHTTAGDIQLQLFREKAPRTVDNFLNGYAQRGFYDGTIFHHVEPGSMVIAGGYTPDLTPKETRAAIYNESRNGLSNTRGMVAMIRDPSNTHSATSQFFINLADNAAFDFNSDTSDEDRFDADWGYCVFGQVTAGMEVVDKIASSQVASHGDFVRVPTEVVLIESVERLR